MSQNNANRRVLSLQAALDKSAVASTDTITMLLDILIREPISGTPVEMMRVVNMAQDPGRSPDLSNEQSGGINFKGNYYEPASFDVNISEKSGEVPVITLSMDDVAGVLRRHLENFQGGVNSDVTVSLVFTGMFDKPAAEQVAEISYTFQVTGSSSSDRTASLTLGAPNLLMSNFPRRQQSRDFCSHEYKGPYCAYSGPLTTCDRTLRGENGCRAHGNTLNFGGFPGIIPRNG